MVFPIDPRGRRGAPPALRRKTASEQLRFRRRGVSAGQLIPARSTSFRLQPAILPEPTMDELDTWKVWGQTSYKLVTPQLCVCCCRKL